MADIKISELSQAESLSLSDLMESAIPYNGGFQSRRMTLAQLSNYLENSVLHTALSTTAQTIIGAINEIVLDLNDYYTKSETYNKTEVDTLIAGVSGLHFLVVQTLPVSDIDPNTIYLVPKQDVGTQDIYDEFIYIVEEAPTPSHWEKIGTTEIDLSDYVTDTELATELLNYVTTSALNTALQSYATTSAMTTALADKVDKVQGKGLSTEDYTTVEKAKLNGIASGAEVNVQSDWIQTDNTKDNFIKNKPTIPTVNDGKLTINQNGTLKGEFTANDSDDVTVNLTDENVKQIADTATSWRRLALVEGGNTEKSSNVFKNSSFWCCTNPIGTTSTVGKSFLAVGNNTSSGTNGNSKGYVRIYGENNKRSQITINGSVTADREVYLPNKDGTIALTDDIPTVNDNTISITQNGTAVDSFTLNQNSNKTIEVKDEKVKQTQISSSNNNYPLLLAYSANGTEETQYTWKDTNLTLNPSMKQFTYDGAIRGNIFEFYLHGISVGSISYNSSNNSVVTLPASSGTLALQSELPTNPVLWSQNNVLGAKNIIPYPYRDMTTTKNGITFTVNADYSVTVGSGSPSANTNWYYCYRETVKSGKYILSGFADTNQGNNFCLRAVINQDLSGSRTYNDYGEGVEVTVNDGEVLSIYLHMSASGVSNNKNHYVMIRPSTIADATYQEPTLTNGQLTNRKVEWESQNILGSKNLLPYPYINNIGVTSAGVTYTVDEKGWIHCSGTSTGNSIFTCSDKTVNGGMFLPNGNYRVSGCPEGGSSSGGNGAYQLIIDATIRGATYTYCYETGDGATFTVNGDDFSNDGAWVRVRCVCRKTVVSDSLVFKPMVMLASIKDNTYEPQANTNRQLTLNKIDKELIAPTENGFNASKAYAVGDYMFWRRGFYRVTTAISQGETITNGTNVTQTTLGAELKRALS